MRKRIIIMFMMALVASAMVSVMGAGAAFAEKQGPCPVCPVEANDQAQGSFFKGPAHAVPNSNGNAEEALLAAYHLHNVTP